MPCEREGGLRVRRVVRYIKEVGLGGDGDNRCKVHVRILLRSALYRALNNE